MKSLLRVLLYGFLLLLVFALVLPAIGFGGPKVIYTLVLGWMGFLKRVLPEISISWSGVGMVVICSVLIVAGIHWLCGWVYTHNTKAEGRAGWKWQWSFCFYAGLWLLFLATMGITGFVHQVGWLITSKEPVMVARRYMKADLRQAALQITMAAQESEWNLAAARKAFNEESSLRSDRKPLVDVFHALFLPGNNEKLAAAIVFPRDAAHRERTGFVVVRDESATTQEEHPMVKLPEVLARFARQEP